MRKAVRKLVGRQSILAKPHSRNSLCVEPKTSILLSGRRQFAAVHCAAVAVHVAGSSLPLVSGEVGVDNSVEARESCALNHFKICQNKKVLSFLIAPPRVPAGPDAGHSGALKPFA